MRSRTAALILQVLAVGVVLARGVAAQQVALAARGPRFLARPTPSTAPEPIDVRQVAVLRKQIAVNLDGGTLKDALREITRQTGLAFAYTYDVVNPDTRVYLKAERITVAAAVIAVLLDTGVDVLLSSPRQAALVRRGDIWARQVGRIAGRVTDEKTGLGIAGADVFLANTRWRTTTDTGGRYGLADVDSGKYTLTVRRPGYGKQSRQITMTEARIDTVDVALTPVVTRLDELVTTATGQQRRRQVASDITLLNVDSLVHTQPVKSVTEILEGRVPGLMVQHTSGAPGDPPRLRLRGAASPLLNNDPIVVVDGVRVYAEQSALRSGNLADRARGAGSEAYATPSPLDYIDPNSIETIEVVKGPSAATLYGQDAANGVIVITTKKGKAGPTRWTLSAEHGITEMVARYPERTLRWGHTTNYGNYGLPVVCPVGDFYSPPYGACAGDSIVHFQLLNEPDLTPFGSGQRTAARLGVSGGVRALTYSVTGSYSHDLGLLRLPDVEVHRYEARLNRVVPDWMRRPQRLTEWGVTSQLTAQLGSTADLTLRASVSRIDQQRSALERQLGELDATYFDRASGIYYQTSGLGALGGILGGIVADSHAVDNYYTRVTDVATPVTTGVTLTWRPKSWLTTTADAGINVVSRVDGFFLPRSISPGFDSVGVLADGQGHTTVQTLNLQATAIRVLGRKFTLRFTTLANYTSTAISDFAVQTRYLVPGQETPGDSVSRPVRGESNLATFGWAIEPALEYGRFSLVPGLRFDGGSSYGGRVSLPTFPKLGGSWTISDEPFFPFKTLFSSFRLRASYGRASRQPGPADRLRLYGSTYLAPVNGQDVLATTLQTLGNTQLRPERSSELEGGFDADLLDSRLSLEITGYRKTTTDALLSTPLPLSIGVVQNVTRNIGVTRNTGLDVTLAAQLLRSAPVTWTTNLILSHRRDEVVRLGPGVEPFYLGDNGPLSGFNEGQRVAPGYPLFGYWTRPVVGYTDLNSDGMISAGEVVVGDTAIYRGSPLPDYTATLSSSVGLWQGAVQLTTDLLYSKGMTQNLSTDLIARQVGLSAGRNDPASPLAEQALVASYGRTPYYWYQRVSTTRLNALTVSYTVPQTWARRVGAERLSIAVQGSNLGLWSNYRGVDPNVNGFATGNLVVDSGQLPQPRTWQVRLNATY